MTVPIQTPIPDSARPKARSIEVYDFRRPTTLAREHSRALEQVFETFSRQWATQLTAKVRVKSTVVSESVDMKTYDEYAASLPSTTAMVLCAIEGFDSKAVIQIPMSTGLSWVGRMVGGNGSQPAPDRKFTQIEQVLVKKLMADAIEDLHYSLGPLLNVAVTIDSFQYNSQFAQAAATSELMIVASFTVTVGEDAAAATLAIPADVLLRELGAANPTTAVGDARELVTEQVMRAPVGVSVGLAPAVVLPRVILNMEVGTMIRLPHRESQPMNVTVDGHILARGAMGDNGSRIVTQIVSIEENPK